MEPRRIRLGDVIDDYCPRCRLIMNHGVVGMVGNDVKKVRCNTCLSEHQFRHGRLPKRRKDERGRLFEEVLKGLAAPGTAGLPATSRAASPEESKAAPEASSAESGGEAAGAPGAGSEESGMAAGSNPAPTEGEAGTPEPAGGASHPHHRRLYTIRRSIADGKATGRGPKKP